MNPYNKYGNRKTILVGITFDSKKEAHRYAELKMMQRGGVVTKLTLQPQFLIHEAFERDGIKYSEIKYIADFDIEYANGERVIEDVKGMKT